MLKGIEMVLCSGTSVRGAKHSQSAHYVIGTVCADLQDMLVAHSKTVYSVRVELGHLGILTLLRFRTYNDE